MPEVPRRPLLQSVPAALVGAGLASTATTAADPDPDPAADGQPVPDGGRGATASVGRVDPARTDVRYLTRERTADVPSSERDAVAFTAREGALLEVQAITVSVDAIEPATTGSHAVEIGPEADGPGTGAGAVVLRGVSSNDRALSFDGVTWRAADREAVPGDEAAQLLATRGLVVDDDRGLVVSYHNRTNAVQTATRTVHLWAVEHTPDDATA
jgi:hypothetical protein